MAVPWISETAQAFWVASGQLGPFPRDLEGAIAFAVPIALLRIPNLCVTDVGTCLRQRRLRFVTEVEDRPLHGFIYAYGGKGLIILDGADPPDELHFTIAHELAHFLLDYQGPRQRAVDKFGAMILSVLDGVRQPSTNERVDALLARTPIGVYTHFMHREGAGGKGPVIAQAESQADRLALELVAPECEVRRYLPRGFEKMPSSKLVISISRVLVRRFCLPRYIANNYAELLYRSWFGGPSVREWLGIP